MNIYRKTNIYIMNKERDLEYLHVAISHFLFSA